MKKMQLFLALLFVGFVTQAQKADQILAKHFKAIGGTDKWQQVTSHKITGTGSTPQGDFPVTMYRKAPNKVKMVINIQGSEFVAQAYDGTTAWSLNPFTGTTATKLDDDATRMLKEEYIENDFINYKKKGHKVTLEGTEELDGVKCYKIILAKKGDGETAGTTETHYFNTENYMEVAQKTMVTAGPFKGSEAYTYMSDYREVDGLTLPFTIEQKVNGSTVFKISIEKSEVNADIEDAVFAFPEE